MIKQNKITNMKRKGRLLLLMVYEAIETFPGEENKDLKTALRDSSTTILWGIQKVFSKKMSLGKENYNDLSLHQLDKLKCDIRKSHQSGFIEDNWVWMIEKQIRELTEEFLNIQKSFMKT